MYPVATSKPYIRPGTPAGAGVTPGDRARPCNMSIDSRGDPDRLRATRLALQAVAEHVLAAALHQATGHIGLRQAPGGLATPPFPGPAGERTIAIDGVSLVVRDRGGERRAPLTTIRAAGELAGVAPGAPADVYTPATPLDLDAPLDPDPDAAARLAAWYALADTALRRLRSEATGDPETTGDPEAIPPETIQLWPEHFDLAVTLDEVNYGASPGDGGHATPYLYVGPWTPPPPDGGYWNESFGASRSDAQVAGVDDAVAFFREGRDRVGRG